MRGDESRAYRYGSHRYAVWRHPKASFSTRRATSSPGGEILTAGPPKVSKGYWDSVVGRLKLLNDQVLRLMFPPDTQVESFRSSIPYVWDTGVSRGRKRYRPHRDPIRCEVCGLVIERLSTIKLVGRVGPFRPPPVHHAHRITTTAPFSPIFAGPAGRPRPETKDLARPRLPTSARVSVRIPVGRVRSWRSLPPTGWSHLARCASHASEPLWQTQGVGRSNLTEAKQNPLFFTSLRLLSQSAMRKPVCSCVQFAPDRSLDTALWPRHGKSAQLLIQRLDRRPNALR